MNRPKISVLIICQNVERTIRRTLESLVQFDEVVVVDGGSTDSTEEIVKEFPNTVFYYNKWPGFIAQRNHSLDMATHEWCFMIDADEKCTNELSEEIFKTISLPDALPMYRIMRTEFFLGQPIEIGLGKSGYQERLFKKSRIRYTGGNHHEHLLDGKLIRGNTFDVGSFDKKLRILHDETYSMDAWVKKLPRFIILVAQEKISKGRRVSALEACFAFFGEFLKAYLKSWRGGRVAFVNCLLHATYLGLVKIYIYQYHAFSKFNSQNDLTDEKNLG